MTQLVTFVRQVRDRLERSAYPNEMAVRTQIVLPILERLGWPVYDTTKVRHEYSLKFKGTTRFVDLALCVPASDSPRCIVELKTPDRDEGDEQLFEYAFHAGAPIALLTNGEIWRFYHILASGTYNERLVRTLDLRRHPPEEASEALERYLSYPNTESDKASDYARKDLSKRINQDKAKKKIPDAWRHLIQHDSEKRLAKLLIDVTASISEYAPLESDVVDFLDRLQPSERALNSTLGRIVDGSPPPLPSSGLGDEIDNRHQTQARENRIERVRVPEGSDIDHRHRTQARTSRKQGPQGPIHYHLGGTAYQAANAKNAYIDIIRKLAEQDQHFLERLEPKLRMRKRKLLVREKSKLSPDERTRTGAAQILNGWWLQTHLSNPAKMRYLKIACSVAGIPFDSPREGLQITLPNA